MRKIITFIEMGLPLIFTLICILLIVIGYVDNIFLEIQKNKIGFIGLIATMCSVFCAIVLTSLSVFGSTASHSIIYLANDKKAVIQFIIYASCTLLGSFFIFILSLIPNINLKLFISIFIITASFLWAYTSAIIIMFYLNIVNVKEEKQSTESLLGEVRGIKKIILEIRYNIENLENKLSK